MRVITAQDLQDKKVLLRLDIDVPIGKGAVSSEQGTRDLVVKDDFRLRLGLPTLRLCMDHAKEVVVMGHIGRPEDKFVPELSVEPIYDWLAENGFKEDLNNKRLRLLQNLRFEAGEDSLDLQFITELTKLGDIFINESFAAYHPSSSTTEITKKLPSFAGLQFNKEVEILTQIRQQPEHPLVVIIGGAKIEDKLPVVESLSWIADRVLVGGKLPTEIIQKNIRLPQNVFIADLNQNGEDIASQTVDSWEEIISRAKMIIWNGPMGKTEGTGGSEQGTVRVANMILKSNAQVIVGGGDTIGFLHNKGLLEEFNQNGFVSSGGGAMLKLLENGTLPTIEALKQSSFSPAI